MECQSQLQLEKQETRRVSRVLDEIVQEVESKAPVLKRQREEYESMQRSMTSLCNKLEQARTVRETSICVCQCVHLFTLTLDKVFCLAQHVFIFPFVVRRSTVCKKKKKRRSSTVRTWRKTKQRQRDSWRIHLHRCTQQTCFHVLKLKG